MKRLFTVLALFIGFYANASVYYNDFKATTGTYTELTNPTVISTDWSGEGWKIPVDANMKLFGIDFPLNSEGFMIGKFGAIVAQHPTQDKMAIFDFFAPKNFTERDNTSSVSYTFEGTEGSRILTIQYKNVGLQDGASSDYVNVQVIIAEDGSMLQMIMGPHSIADVSKVFNFPEAKGPSISIVLGTKDLSKKDEVWSLTGNPASPSASTAFGYVWTNGIPADGQTYTWKHNTVTNPPKLSLVSPIGMENWKGGEVHQIKWTSNDVAKIKIEYTFEGFNKYNLVAENVDASLGQYSWTVPNTPSNQCMVKITDMSDPNRYQESGTFFTITKGTASIAEDGLEAGLKLFPNPSQGDFSLTVPQGFVVVSTRLTDLSGRTVSQVSIVRTGEEYHFDTKGIKPGMYLLNVATRKEVYTLKLDIR